MQEILEKEILNSIKKLFPEVDSSGVSVDVSDNFGDYATNAAMVLAKRVGKSPRDVADELVKVLEKKKIKLVEKIEVAGPGFINFYINDEFFVDSVAEILKEGHGIGKNKKEKGQKIMVEYTDPNPFKVFHIGHLMTNVIGESLARLHEFCGAKVKRANYQGDVGLHVAKALWGMKQTRDEMPSNGASLTEKTAYLGKAYSFGADAYENEENIKAQEEIKEINKQVYEVSCEESLRELYDKGRQWSLDHFEEIYRKLGTRFDYYFFESQTFSEGTQLVKDNLKKGVFEKSDGAVIFPGGKYGLHDRVFLNSEGLPTYEAKDLGLAYLKYKTYKADLSLVVTACEQTEYFKVVIEAMK
ncbi:MAG: arginine--tRNA ligase, partial [Candidatus Pacebacteria bacterium]|nr:arginine--tRNA ligase [Candidatus Paceibacterota bacterium]